MHAGTLEKTPHRTRGNKGWEPFFYLCLTYWQTVPASSSLLYQWIGEFLSPTQPVRFSDPLPMGSGSGDQCPKNRVILLFVLAQLTIGYGWASMAHIWNWTDLRKPLSIAKLWIRSFSAVLPRWKRRVRTVQHTISLSQASPQAANVTFSYFHSFPLSELCWRKLQITFQAWDVKQLNCLNLKALKMKCYKQVTFHILAVKHLLPKSG